MSFHPDEKPLLRVHATADLERELALSEHRERLYERTAETARSSAAAERDRQREIRTAMAVRVQP